MDVLVCWMGLGRDLFKGKGRCDLRDRDRKTAATTCDEQGALRATRRGGVQHGGAAKPSGAVGHEDDDGGAL